MKGTWFVVAVLLAVPGCTTAQVMATVAVGPELRLVVEVARAEDELREGLAGRGELSGDGMVFLFGERARREVWMAGMEIPLDVAWIVDGRVVAVRTLQPCAAADQAQCPRWESPVPVDMLLEVSEGALQGVEPGSVVSVGEDGS